MQSLSSTFSFGGHLERERDEKKKAKPDGMLELSEMDHQ